MDVTIRDLDLNSVDKLISPDTEIYGRIIRRESRFDHTVDILLDVAHFGCDEYRLLFVFPNECSLEVPIASNEYLKIEVM